MNRTDAFFRLNSLLIGVFFSVIVSSAYAQSAKFHQYDSLFNDIVSFDIEKAQFYLKEQRKYCSTKLEKVDYWLNSMMLNYKQNQFDAAMKDGRMAENYLENVDDRRSMTYVKLQSLIKWKQGDFVGANQLLLKPLKENTITESTVRAHLYNLILNNYLSLEEYDSALVVARTVNWELNQTNALKEKHSPHYKNLYQTNLLSIGNIYYFTTVYDSALFYYQKAYTFDSSDPVWSINCLLGIADVLTLKGDYEKSGEYYVQIIENLESRPEGITLTHAYFNSGTNFKEQENVNEANNYFRKAEHLSRKLNYDLILGLSLQEIGEYFFKKDELDSAQFYVEKSIPILEKIKNARGLCFAYCHLSRIQSKYGNKGESFRAAKKAREWMLELNTLEARAVVWTTLYEFHDRYGPVDSALFYLKASHDANDSVKGIEVQNSLNNLLVKYETQLKEKENQLLRVEISEKSAQVKRKEEERRFWQILMSLVVLLFTLVLIIGANGLKIRRQKLEVKEKKLVHLEQIRRLLMRKLDDADLAVHTAEQTISELKDKQPSSQENNQRPELLIESMRHEKDWVAFMVEFELIYTRFFFELKKVSSNDFTSGERRLLAMIKLGLSNQEVADYIFISIDSVKKSKNRLYKKINLPNVKLKPADFIRNIE